MTALAQRPSIRTAQEILEILTNSDPSPDPKQLPPKVIFSKEFDANKVQEWWSAYLNPGWREEVNKRISEGFETLLIQTEIHTTGHTTMIYMAKMKA